jgi:5'-nucleotidase
VADAVLWQAVRLAPICGVPPPRAGLVNGGGIRIDRVVPPGPLTAADIYDIIPFPNTVTILRDVSPARLKDILEHGLAGRTEGSGRFPQVAGMTVAWNPAGQARGAGSEGAGSGQTSEPSPGSRVREVALSDGTRLVADGKAVPGAPAISLATIDYLGRGGNGYPMADLGRTVLPSTWQRALRDYLREGLDGKVTAEKYPERGGGRVGNK